MEELIEQTREMTIHNTIAFVGHAVPVTAEPLQWSAVDAFLRSAEETASLAHILNSRDEDDYPSFDSTQVSSSQLRATRLAEASRSIDAALDKIKEAAAKSIIQRLVTLGHKTRTTKAKLDSCYPTLIEIAKKLLAAGNGLYPELILSRIAEACYVATTSRGGTIGSDETPHPNIVSAREKKELSWPAFWREVLTKCPHGSTLFDTGPILRLPVLSWPVPREVKIPPYLFRVFDYHSISTGDDNEILSQAAADRMDSMKKDLLSQDKDTATEKLYRHLKWHGFSSSDPDNLVSWTSSLLFAIQYAVYRCYQHGTDPADIKICVVDTSKFAPGQFVRDLHLIELHNSHDTDPAAHDFFNFRLTDRRYQNGEYLSQGLINVAGRSRTTSLGELEDSGLYTLYPEFQDPKIKGLWAKQVDYLRVLWSSEVPTTRSEVKKAAKIGQCLKTPGQKPTTMTSMLLCFKNRARAPDSDDILSMFPSTNSAVLSGFQLRA